MVALLYQDPNNQQVGAAAGARRTRVWVFRGEFSVEVFVSGPPGREPFCSKKSPEAKKVFSPAGR